MYNLIVCTPGEGRREGLTMMRTERLHLRLTPEERRAIDARAAEQGMSRSALLRELVLQSRPSVRRVEVASEQERPGRRREVAVPA